MKTFAQFLQQLEEAKSYRKVYASKVAAARQRQSDDIENKEYVKHVDRLRNDIRQEIKQEYGIKDKK